MSLNNNRAILSRRAGNGVTKAQEIGVNDKLNTIALVAIAVLGAGSITGTIVLEIMEKPIPPALIAIAATCVGTIAGFLRAPAGPTGSQGQAGPSGPTGPTGMTGQPGKPQP